MRASPAQTKLVICVWHPFTEWRPKPLLAESIRARYPEMRVLHLPNYETLPQALPDTNIFVGYSLRAEQLAYAPELKWIHSTAAGVAQLMYPELRQSGITVTNVSVANSFTANVFFNVSVSAPLGNHDVTVTTAGAAAARP